MQAATPLSLQRLLEQLAISVGPEVSGARRTCVLRSAHGAPQGFGRALRKTWFLPAIWNFVRNDELSIGPRESVWFFFGRGVNGNQALL